MFPPTRTVALVEFSHTNEAKGAFKNLAYSRFKSLPLYLEWAPIDTFVTSGKHSETQASAIGKSAETRKVLPSDEPHQESATATLFVKNLNFSTTLAKLCEIFSPLSGYVNARIAEKTHKTGERVSMGFGYVEFILTIDLLSFGARMMP